MHQLVVQCLPFLTEGFFHVLAMLLVGWLLNFGSCHTSRTIALMKTTPNYFKTALGYGQESVMLPKVQH